MDWANERWVRLYTRDTITFKRWSWTTRAVLALLLRKVDRAGVLDCEGLEPAEALAVMLEVPGDVASTALLELEKTGTIVVNCTEIAVPSSLEAQETSQSDRLRQSESRARRRDLAVHGVTKRDEMSHAVTAGHTVSQPVTPDQTDQPDQTEELTPQPPKGGKPKKRKGRKPAMTHTEQVQVQAVLDHLTGLTGGKRKTPNKSNSTHILARIRDGSANCDELKAGLDAVKWAADRAEDPKFAPRLDAVTPFRDSNWEKTERYVREMNAPAAAGPTPEYLRRVDP